MTKQLLLGCSAMVALPFLVPVSVAAAQDDTSTDDGDVIIVEGIRRSLTDAADVKRNEAGVVDAITAEDIGKFPDANLAESLQRITGVSIDRRNNEGNQISVRGLGPSFNLVTLNGRQMPVASSPELETLNSQTQSRAFNFAEIASESVSGVNVYKTARADLPTGGIGATVDIQTARPFDVAGTRGVVSIAGIYDFSAEEGPAVTPEVGGLFSHTFNDTFGVLVTGSYSKRNFREFEDHLDGWDRWDPGSGGHNNLIAAGAIDANEGTVYAPRTHITEIADNERERINAQFVAQFRPVETLTVTADYTLSRFTVEEQRYQTGLFGLYADAGVTSAITGPVGLTQNGTLSSVSYAGRAADALAYNNELRTENNSFGLNVEWEATERLTLEVDGHVSTSESQPDGQSNDAIAIYQGALGVDFHITYGSGRPTITIDDSGAFRGEEQFGGGAPIPGVDSYLDVDALSPLGSLVRTVAIENQVSQAQFRGSWAGNDGDLLQSIDFGASFIEYDVDTASLSTNFVFQGLDDCIGCQGLFNEVSNVSTGIFDTIQFFDSAVAIDELFPVQTVIPSFDVINTTEESYAAFVNFNFEGEFGGMVAKLSAGLRYEETDVVSSSSANLPLGLRTTTGSEQEVIFTNEVQELRQTGSYDNFIPAVDFQLQPTDETVLRFSYGKTLARPDLNALRPSLNIADTRPFGPFNAFQGNPGLLPYLADNIDVAAEWYYDEGSYAAVTVFHKSVENYIGTDTTTGEFLNANGDPITDPSPRFMGTAVESQPSDPVAIFNITQNVNTGDADINGIEFALQHLFGDTGFGVQANYTIVDSDAEFDPQAVDQTVNLIGLSDSANLVGFYEQDKFQVRIAANWRDEFLFSENQLRVQNEPVFFDEFLQIDASASYDYSERISVFVEALNITGEDQLQRGRFTDQFLFQNDQRPRLTFGVRGRL
ncbi:MAG: TonB-dependent receptor [Pseudomonadota bacterium]